MTLDAANPPTSPPARRRPSRGRRLTGVAALAGLVAATVIGVTHLHPGSGPAAAESHLDSLTPLRGGTYTLLDGRSASLSTLRGQPVLVWFIADGCASCAASIPTIAAHLSAFADTGTRVLALGLYGAFGYGRQASSALTSFARSAAGPAFADPTWTWGLASEQLTIALDPGGVPDAYYLLDPSGRVSYHNSVPVSTIGALLARLRGGTPTNRSSDSAAPPATALP